MTHFHTEPLRRGWVMKEFSKYVGLDVHKELIAIAVASAGSGEVRYFGEILPTSYAVTKLVKKLCPEREWVSFW